MCIYREGRADTEIARKLPDVWVCEHETCKPKWYTFRSINHTQISFHSSHSQETTLRYFTEGPRFRMQVILALRRSKVLDNRKITPLAKMAAIVDWTELAHYRALQTKTNTHSSTHFLTLPLPVSSGDILNEKQSKITFFSPFIGYFQATIHPTLSWQSFFTKDFYLHYRHLAHYFNTRYRLFKFIVCRKAVE